MEFKAILKEGENFNHRCRAANALGVNIWNILRIEI